MYILLAAALLPAIALMAYVYSKDRVEKEPAGLVARVFLLGALSGPVAAIVESVLFEVFEAAIPAGTLLIFVEYFIGVAAVEEACKYFCLNTIRKNPAFDYVFDAVVYAVAAALGFAALENILYVFDGGFEVALTRAVFSVPGHMADGVVMGVFFGFARKHELHGNKGSATMLYWLAFLLPVIEHGFYDTALSLESDLTVGLAMVFDLAFIAVAFVLVHRTSKNDTPLHPAPPAPQWPPRSTTFPTAGTQAPFQQQASQQPFSQAGAYQQPYPQTGTYQQPAMQPDLSQPYQQAFQQPGAPLPYQQPGSQQGYRQPDAQPYAQQQPAYPGAQQQTYQQANPNTWPPAADATPEPPARYGNGPTVRYSSQSSTMNDNR